MLRLEDVCFRYKNSNRDILQNIYVEFTEGQMHAIVGPSGTGKTTLLSVIAGLCVPTSGTVWLGDEDLSKTDLNKYRSKKISMIFQSFHLFPLLTVAENVAYLMENSGVRSKVALARAKKLLEIVGIDDSKHSRYPANISGGEQQRVAIARALSTGARIIIADEPTGNLDTANSDSIVEILKNLAHTENYCVIIVTHNPDIATACDVVLRMADGKINR